MSTNATGGEESTATTPTHARLATEPGEHKRALVEYQNQVLAATIQATEDLLEQEWVRARFDRYPRADLVPTGAVVRILDDAAVLLGVDGEGCRHLWDAETDVVSVFDGDGEPARQPVRLDAHDRKDVRTWTHYVAQKRGWKPVYAREERRR